MSDAFLGVDRSASGRKWRLRPLNERDALAHAQRLGVPEIIGRLLAGRGVALDAGASFLNPTLRECLPDPSSVAGMEAGVERLAEGITRGEAVAVFGDYDVDGATSSALLWHYFNSLGLPLRVYIPDRMREGYGPNAAALRRLAAEGIKLCVTVDCGTLAHGALAEGVGAGLEIIVADHHLPGATLPPVCAVINPNRLDDRSGCGQLAAVGVTFLLIAGVNRALRRRGYFGAGRAEPDLTRFLDLVALGTVCDVVPLTGVNRALVTQGLKVMAKGGNKGLGALMRVAGVKAAPRAFDLGFLLGPRINAGGRVGQAGLGVSLLTAMDETRAAELALRLDTHNRERQAIEAHVLEDAIGDAQRRGVRAGLVAAAGPGFHPGVVGIVAARLKERFGLPAFVFSLQNGEAKGSARSIAGVDVGSAVHRLLGDGVILSGGGHAAAAGLTVAEERLEETLARLSVALAPEVAAAQDARDVLLDGAVSPGAADLDLIETLGRAGPFGAGNPEPQFGLAGVRIAYADIVGSAHVRLTVTGPDGARLKAISFRSAGEALGDFLLKSRGKSIHLAGRLTRDDWSGSPRAQLIIEDAAAA
ncbi:MAG: single-stranded-DNA-specific exonuclease RecJ [Alphaproteobacteria bacterium]|nr:single-stranded-DNA-specific exonuclease RecJ [Alphaproteobacteria bacterium]